MSSCFVEGCKKPTKNYCCCRLPYTLMCENHTEYHKTTSQVAHYIESIQAHPVTMMSTIKSSLQELSIKITKDSSEAINAIKLHTKNDFTLISKLESSFNAEFQQKQSYKIFLPKIFQDIKKLSPYYVTHFKTFIEQFEGLQKSIELEYSKNNKGNVRNFYDQIDFDRDMYDKVLVNKSNGQRSPSHGVPNPSIPSIGIPNPGFPNIGIPNPSIPSIGIPNPGFPNIGIPIPKIPSVGISYPSIPNLGNLNPTIPSPGNFNASIPNQIIPYPKIPGQEMFNQGLSDQNLRTQAFYNPNLPNQVPPKNPSRARLDIPNRPYSQQSPDSNSRKTPVREIPNPDIEETWYVSSKQGSLKPLPKFVIDQILEGRRRNQTQIKIINNKRVFCNFVDLDEKKYYWVNLDGTVKNEYERLFITKKKRNPGNNY
jgi:hypothetical protein